MDVGESRVGPARTIAVLVAAVAGVDALTKSLAVRWWSGPTFDVGPMHLHVLRNPGGPFGLAPRATVWFTILGLVAIPVFARAAIRIASRSVVVGFGLVLGGTVGNVTDRLLRGPGPFRGAVVDWVRVTPYGPTFNLSDVALRVGAGIIIVVASLRSSHARAVDAAAPAT